MEKEFIRKLGPIEQAFTIANTASPLCVVCALHLSAGPAPQRLVEALAQLQTRHLLLQAGITTHGSRLYFQRLDPLPPLPFTHVENTDADTWRSTAAQALNTTFDPAGPLLKCWLLNHAGGGRCTLIVCLHHAIIDGTSARLILHELLSLAGGLALPAPVQSLAVPQFPAAYRSFSLVKKLLRFAARQAGDAWRYRSGGVAGPIPAHSENALISLRLPVELSQRLLVAIRRRGLSLNSVLLAAMTEAVLRHKHAEQPVGQARVISFAELRPALQPQVSDLELGCHISMLRLGVPVQQGQPVEQLAARIQRAIGQAGRQGEVFLMALISKFLMQAVLRMKNQRLGVSALSFIGTLNLQPEYGPIGLQDVQAFITNNRFGPEFSAFGKILFDSIGLDFTYLTAETSAAEAQQMVQDLKEILQSLANLPDI